MLFNTCGFKVPLRGADPSRRQRQVGSLAGAANLSNDNAGVLKPSSPFRHNRKPLIFQWALTLGNAGIGSVSIPAFRSVNAH